MNIETSEQYKHIENVSEARHWIRKAKSVYVRYSLNKDAGTNVRVSKAAALGALSGFSHNEACCAFFYPESGEIYLSMAF